jgi:hypothetical protein
MHSKDMVREHLTSASACTQGICGDAVQVCVREGGEEGKWISIPVNDSISILITAGEVQSGKVGFILQSAEQSRSDCAIVHITVDDAHVKHYY